MKYTARRIAAEEFGRLFTLPPHVYDSVPFNELNSDKVKAVHYIAITDGNKVRFGIVLGERGADCGSTFYSPFSAPFGSFLSNTPQRMESMEAAVDALREYVMNICCNVGSLSSHDGKPLAVLTLPPEIYSPSETAKWVNVLTRKARLHHVDLNYFMPLNAGTPYVNRLNRNARKNLNNACKHEWKFEKLDTSSFADISRAYGIISLNRKEHGYPLRMTLDAVVDTTKIVEADFFVLSLKNPDVNNANGFIDVAAAQVFHVASGIVQVIYWGDLGAYSHFRTMNRLAELLYSHYSKLGLKILDIGPSTEEGTPNYGLCSFKEDIGCCVCTKYVFEL